MSDLWERSVIRKAVYTAIGMLFFWPLLAVGVTVSNTAAYGWRGFAASVWHLSGAFVLWLLAWYGVYRLFVWLL